MANAWMVRAEKDGVLYDQFKEQNAVAIGWADIVWLGFSQRAKSSVNSASPSSEAGEATFDTSIAPEATAVFVSACAGAAAIVRPAAATAKASVVRLVFMLNPSIQRELAPRPLSMIGKGVPATYRSFSVPPEPPGIS